MIGTGNRISVYDDRNSQLRSYKVCNYSLAHITSQHQDLRLGIIREILIICQLKSSMAMSDVKFEHIIILCMMVWNIGAGMDREDKKVSARIGQENWTRKKNRRPITFIPVLLMKKSSKWILGDNMLLWLPFYFLFFYFFIALEMLSNRFETPDTATFILVLSFPVSSLY